MTDRNLIFTIALLIPVVSFSQQSKNDSAKVVIQKISIEEIVDEVPSPPSHIKSNFKTLHEWLFSICKNDSTQKTIEQYKFGLFESSNENILFLIGVNTYEEGENRFRTSIEFQPS